MAKAVTLKNNDNEEIYPVTSADLVTGTIPTSSLRDSSVTTPKIDNLAVTTSKLADNSITSSKIDYSTMGPVWSSFYFTLPQTGQNVVVTTKKGTQLTFKISNGGTCIRIVSGGSNIKLVRNTWMATYSSSITGNHGAHGLASGSTITNRYFAWVNNGSAGGAGTSNTTATTGTGGECYGSIAAVTNAPGESTNAVFTYSRIGTSQKWELVGEFGHTGYNTAIQYDVVCTSANGYVPATYQRSATESNVTAGFNYIEILEV